MKITYKKPYDAPISEATNAGRTAEYKILLHYINFGQVHVKLLTSKAIILGQIWKKIHQVNFQLEPVFWIRIHRCKYRIK